MQMIEHSVRRGYRTDEVAEFFGMSDNAVRRLIRSKQIRAVRIGRRLIVPATEVDRLAGRDLAGAAA